MRAQKDLDTHSPTDHHDGDADEVDDQAWGCTTNGIYNRFWSIKEFISSEPLENPKWIIETADGQTNRIDLLQVYERKQLLGLKRLKVIQAELDAVLPDYFDVFCQNEEEHGPQIDQFKEVGYSANAKRKFEQDFNEKEQSMNQKDGVDYDLHLTRCFLIF